jgi:hypothetical protein
MATYRITYTDKNKSAPLGSFEGQWRDADANEVKRVVNNLSLLVTGLSEDPEGTISVGDISAVVELTDVDDVIVEHGLGKKPSLQAFDSAWNSVEVYYKHINNNSLRIITNKSWTGHITLN